MLPSPPPLYAALWLPRFALQAVLRTSPPPRGPAFAVLDVDADLTPGEAENRGRVLHASAAAERAGVVAGMTPSQALARCASLILLRRDALAETAAQRELAECAVQWTPDYELTQPGLCVLDVSRAPTVREQGAACGGAMREWLAARRLEASVGLAGNPGLASLAARAANGVLQLDERSSGDRAALDQLPVAVLQPSAAVAEVLRLWGVRSLAQFVALSRADIAARLGPEGLALRDLAGGGRERLLRLVRPATGFRDEVEFEHPVESLEPLLFILRRMLDELCARLAGLWLVAAAERLELRFENQTTHERVLRVAEPTRDAALLLRVLHTHLEGLTAAAPIIAVALELTPVRPACRQASLFERSLRDPNRFAETLAQLEALLGTGRVGRARLLPSRRPDAFVLDDYLEEKSGAPDVPASRESLAQGLPLRCYRPRKQVGVRLENERPVALETEGRLLAITEARGAWLLSGDWWSAASWRREVWEIAASDGALYQLARENGRWVLDGVFG